MRLLLLPLLLLAWPTPGHGLSRDDVHIYRCTDARGQLTLRDTPCLPGEKQQSETRLRPRDPAPRAVSPPATPATAADAPRPIVHYVLQAPPRTLYQCQAPDGSRYLSESPQGRQRWQSLWASWPATGPLPRPPYYPPIRIAGAAAQAGYSGRHGHIGIAGGSHTLSTRREVGVYGPGASAQLHRTVPVGGMWVADVCNALPAAEACAELSAQRAELSRRFVHAMPSERAQIERDTAVIDEHMAQACRR
ncbi:hypothetical protein [Luteimonas sp. e5]